MVTNGSSGGMPHSLIELTPADPQLFEFMMKNTMKKTRRRKKSTNDKNVKHGHID